MGVENLKEIFLNLFMTILITAGPVLLVSLLVGLVISFLQAVTQIQEMTLTFVPKILALMAGLYLFSNWMLERLLGFTHDVIQMIPQVIR